MSTHHDKHKNPEEKKFIFGKASQVTREKSWASKRVLPFVMGGVGLLLIVMIFRGNHQEEKKQDEVQQHKIEVASTVLKKRLEALKEKAPQASLSSTQTAVNNATAYSKELIARMNAPTSLYENGSNNLSSASSANALVNSVKKAIDGSVPEATFIGKGADQEFGNTSYQTTSVEAKHLNSDAFLSTTIHK